MNLGVDETDGEQEALSQRIARKLQIHSPAGLTIYAIVNKLVELSEVKMNL